MRFAQYFRALTAITFIASTLPGRAQPALPAASEPAIAYTVRSGDSLIRLSTQLLRQRSDWAEVARFNQLADANVIRPGQTIQVPVRLMKWAPARGKVISIAGDVRLGSEAAQAGNPLLEGMRLQTGANSSALIELADGSRVTLLPNTLAELATSRGYAMRGAGNAVVTWFSGLMRLVQGSLDLAANKLADRATPLQIQTPTSLVGVRGTQFRVAFDGLSSQNARTEVLEGLVQADNTAQGSGAALEKGQGAVLNPAVREIRVVDLLKAPDLSATPPAIFKPRGTWTLPALDGAAAFRVQVASDAAFGRIVRDVVVTGNTANLADLPDGNWFARVRGIDADGIEGFDSVKAVQLALAPLRSWRIATERLDVDSGRHALRFVQEGLQNGDAITATLSLARTPSAPIAQATVGASNGEALLDLGTLQAGTVYLLEMSVLQNEGAAGISRTYRFTALSGSGWVRGTLEQVSP
jgi:hypothetical protein